MKINAVATTPQEIWNYVNRGITSPTIFNTFSHIIQGFNLTSAEIPYSWSIDKGLYYLSITSATAPSFTGYADDSTTLYKFVSFDETMWAKQSDGSGTLTQWSYGLLFMIPTDNSKLHFTTTTTDLLINLVKLE